MRQLTTLEDCRLFRNSVATQQMALVPTMGALHSGHLALIDTAKRHADVVAVSIFVNPLQFGPNEDYTRYPRPIEKDLEACRNAGVDAVFMPEVATLYPQLPDAPACVVMPAPQLTEIACGASRPGHFTGVCTVVAKLFNIIQPDIAVFGEKDAQQLAILRQMVTSLNFPVEIISHPLERDAHGLAMSSRNQYLTESVDKNAALLLSRWLNALAILARPGLPTYEAYGLARAQAFEGVPDDIARRFELDYILAVEDATFQPVDVLSPTTRILLAAWIGEGEQRVRLLDNHLLQNGAIPGVKQDSISRDAAAVTT